MGVRMIEQINKNTILDCSNETPFMAFPALRQFDFIKHGFSSRLGGVSNGVFSSMNLGFNRGDKDELVRENYNRICGSIGIGPENLVFTDQVHKANVRRAGLNDKGKGMIHKRDYCEIDAHITNECEVPLLIFSADCVPIFLVDPVNKAIGLAHSGWKGTVLKIGKVTVERMKEEFGTNPFDVVAVIGPSIGPECYEVSQDVVKEFEKNFQKSETERFTKNTEHQKYRLDLWKANKYILLSAGLKEENITISGLCTMCNPKFCFSHRAMGKDRGSMAGFLQLT